MNYALVVQDSVKSREGVNGTFHVTTPLIENRGLEKLCLQTSLRTVTIKEGILQKVDEALEQKGIKLAEDTYSIDLTPNRLVLCFKNDQTASYLAGETIRINGNEHLKFFVNEPKLWVMTIFKVPGYYDIKNHQYLRSFASEFGVVHRIYRKTVLNQGKSYGGPNIIVQYSSLYALPPKRIILDGKHNLDIYWTKPRQDMFHPDYIQASESGNQTNRSEEKNENNEVDFIKSKIPHSRIPKLSKTPLAITVRAENEGREVVTKKQSPPVVEEQNKEPFFLVTKNKNGKRRNIAQQKEPVEIIMETPNVQPPSSPSLSGIDKMEEGEISPGFETEEVYESEGEDIDPEEIIETISDNTSWGESPMPKESQPIEQFSSSSDERDVPTKNRIKKEKKNRNKKGIQKAKMERRLKATKLKIALSPPSQNVSPHKVQESPHKIQESPHKIQESPQLNISSRKSPPKVNRHLSAENLAKCEKKVTQSTRKRNKLTSPPRPGFKKREPLNKKPLNEMSDSLILAKHHIQKRTKTPHHSDSEDVKINLETKEIESLGPLSWILLTGHVAIAWSSFLAAKIKAKYDINMDDIKGLPNVIQQHQIELRCIDGITKEEKVEAAWNILLNNKLNKLCDEAIDIISQNEHLFVKDV